MNAMKERLKPLPLPANPTFEDLVFRPHYDGDPTHTHALHQWPGGRTISITKGGSNFGTPEAPYEMMDSTGEIHAPLTPAEVTELLRSHGQQMRDEK